MPDQATNRERRLVISRQTHQGQYFTEQLNQTTRLDMMLIPGGRFIMGQTEAEKTELIRLSEAEDYQKYYLRELPTHLVTVQLFFMSKYPITQAQWRAVAAYPAVEQELNPDPSHFKAGNRPVEQISWDDATEFCHRLTQDTGRTYRLPSEAEWEYACRAGTPTPFHFGETLSDALANYHAHLTLNDALAIHRGDEGSVRTLSKGIYGRGVHGQYREETTKVGQFPANPFGLHDMHGNVWEWCEDDFHSNYNDAPSDGTAWVENDRSTTDRLLRGGSWSYYPQFCRSASRNYNSRGGRDGDIGFRVCCVPPRTLLSS